jgi:nucleoid DNA-binding protein
MNKTDLIKVVAEKNNYPYYSTKKTIETFLEEVKRETIESGRMAFGGFGTFKRYVSKERKGRNPQTGESIIIPSKTSIKFKQAENGK